MDEQAKAAFILSQVAMMNARIAGMQAENNQRIHLQQAMAYIEADFAAVEREYATTLGYNAVLLYFRD